MPDDITIRLREWRTRSTLREDIIEAADTIERLRAEIQRIEIRARDGFSASNAWHVCNDINRIAQQALRK